MDKILKQYKCLSYISIIYICILICSAMLGNKSIITKFGAFSAASLTGPLWFILSDIVAEVYGYKCSNKLLWDALACELLFIGFCLAIINMPSPKAWYHQEQYNLVLGHLFRIYLSQLAAIIIAGYINVYFITRWKVLLRGKYFWLRSIGASGISEAFFSTISIALISLGTISLSNLLAMVIWSLLIKILYSIMLAYPATLVVHFLKITEQIDVYDSYSLNPFQVVK